MLNKVDSWLNMCDEDMITAKCLLEGKRLLPMAFFCHLITEKALKAVVTQTTNEFPPKTHDLIKLAIKCGLYNELNPEQIYFLNDLMPYQIEGRYVEYKDNVAKTLTIQKCEMIYKETEAFLCWIKKKLEK